MNIFTKNAQANIEKTGNVWGVTQEYLFNFTVRMPFNLCAKLQMRSNKNLMGRFGGGWRYSLGILIGGSTVILNCLVFTIRIERFK